MTGIMTGFSERSEAGRENLVEAYRAGARETLRTYLRVLELQRDAIQEGDTDLLETYLEEGKERLAELRDVQRVLYTLVGGETDHTLSELLEHARRQQKANRELLLVRRDEISEQISATRVPARAKSVFRPATHAAAGVDLSL